MGRAPLFWTTVMSIDASHTVEWGRLIWGLLERIQGVCEPLGSKILWKSPNELFGQLNMYNIFMNVHFFWGEGIWLKWSNSLKEICGKQFMGNPWRSSWLCGKEESLDSVQGCLPGKIWFFYNGLKSSDSANGLVSVELKLSSSFGLPKMGKQWAQCRFTEILRKGVTSGNLAIYN